MCTLWKPRVTTAVYIEVKCTRAVAVHNVIIIYYVQLFVVRTERGGGNDFDTPLLDYYRVSFKINRLSGGGGNVHIPWNLHRTSFKLKFTRVMGM